MTSDLLSVSGLHGGSSGGLSPSGRPRKRTWVKSAKSTAASIGLGRQAALVFNLKVCPYRRLISRFHNAGSTNQEGG